MIYNAELLLTIDAADEGAAIEVAEHIASGAMVDFGAHGKPFGYKAVLATASVEVVVPKRQRAVPA